MKHVIQVQMEQISPQSEQMSRLELYFKKKDCSDHEDEDVGDNTFFEDLWKPTEPKLLKQWSIWASANDGECALCAHVHEFP